MSINAQKHEITTSELARLGANEIGYMRMMTSEQILEAFPETKNVMPDMNFWALFGADGEPLAIGDHPEAVFSTAYDNDIKTVRVH